MNGWKIVLLPPDRDEKIKFYEEVFSQVVSKMGYKGKEEWFDHLEFWMQMLEECPEISKTTPLTKWEYLLPYGNIYSIIDSGIMTKMANKDSFGDSMYWMRFNGFGYDEEEEEEEGNEEEEEEEEDNDEE